MGEAKEEQLTFASFKGLGYVSMFMGVPLGPLLVCAALGVLGGFIGCAAFGPIGLVFPALSGATVLFLKVLCETDNKAVERMKWSWKALLLRFKRGSKILTVSPNKQGPKNEHFFRRLKKIHRTG